MRSMVFSYKNVADPTQFLGVRGELTIDPATMLMSIHNGIIPGGVLLNEPIEADDIQLALGFIPINPEQIAQSNGIASLDASGHIPISQLPSSLINISYPDDPSLDLIVNNTIDGGFF